MAPAGFESKAGRPTGSIAAREVSMQKTPVAAWVDEHGHYLFRYALARVPDEHVAEDVVQETFLSAVRAIESFRGESSLRTWLVTLLRRRIADHYRKRGRREEPEPIDASDPEVDAWFDQRGRWIQWPGAFDIDPQALSERADFWAAFEACLAALPGRLGEAFSLRVKDDLPAGEVCKVLSITATNLWVALHRARARLRACLEANWFDPESKEQG
jgi:RNA polymerase sigma-70 factor (ECF subfamily)